MTRIAICAPATPITRERAGWVYAYAKTAFPQVELLFHEQCFAEEGHFAGSDAVRLAALLECANDPSCDAVWFARGGYGSNRIAALAVDQLHDSALKKTYIGYSDNGYILAALYRAGIGNPVHGPMVIDGSASGRTDGLNRAINYLNGARDGLEGSLDGRPAVAFNLMTLAMICGTEMMPDLTDHVVMVEEVSEYLYAVDRLFFHITQHLHGIAGLRLGRVSDVPENARPFGADPEQIARYWCGREGIPYLGKADIGHDLGNKIVPFGLAGRSRAS
ncbi:LD-carboxypeptidase [Altericroceibacterium spongiae]|uniref:LD-carboxypeptidase n=1 Tax=Altericroceibacterium spongiae TaxID=2320269 RepID=A0A420EF25_9SPHN|nr:LD-carboxypeptidase [Altericroceibacterium spongiae]RKF19273.1 LD-carboxypeptidase [Altericroceibacterium spongiae]